MVIHRGDLFLVTKPSPRDPKRQRVLVVVSRPKLIESSFGSVICAPIYTDYAGLTTQVPVGIEKGLKHPSSIYCDELFSVNKSVLTHYIGSLSEVKLHALHTALRIALDIEDPLSASPPLRNGNH